MAKNTDVGKPSLSSSYRVVATLNIIFTIDLVKTSLNYYGDQAKEDEMRNTRDVHGREEKCK